MTTTCRGSHTLTLDRVPHTDGAGFWSRCSCGWQGDQFSTLQGNTAYHSDDADECETAAIEQGSEHVASQG